METTKLQEARGGSIRVCSSIISRKLCAHVTVRRDNLARIARVCYFTREEISSLACACVKLTLYVDGVARVMPRRDSSTGESGEG